MMFDGFYVPVHCKVEKNFATTNFRPSHHTTSVKCRAFAEPYLHYINTNTEQRFPHQKQSSSLYMGNQPNLNKWHAFALFICR